MAVEDKVEFKCAKCGRTDPPRSMRYWQWDWIKRAYEDLCLGCLHSQGNEAKRK